MLKFLIFLTILTRYKCISAEVGDKCTVDRNGQAGVCKVGRDCIIAQEEAKIGIKATLCGFLYNRIPIVCCEGATVSNAHPVEDNLFFPIDNNLPICEQKCIEYTRSTRKEVYARPLSTNGESTSVSVQNCDLGIPLIVGGARAKAKEFPFMAAIGYKGDDGIHWNCGGTLISHRYVMTAAHCTNSRSYGEPVRVRLGDLDLKDDHEESQPKDFGIAQIIVHPSYEPLTKRNDIALLKLSEKVTFTLFIKPACLWNRFPVNNDNVTATGWGATEEGGDTSSVLMKVRLNLFQNSRCDKAYKGQYFPNGLPKTMMCVGELAGGKDTCQGDSGGPITITKSDDPCVFYTVGITSFGKACAAENTPAVYTRVSEFVSWIEKTVW